MAVFTRCVLLFVGVFFLSLSGAVAQTSASFTLRNVSWWGYVGDEYGPRLKFFRDNWDNDYNLLWDGCIKLGSASSGSQSFSRYIGVVSNVSESNPVFDLIVETWEERKRGGDDCGFSGSAGANNKPDRYQSVSTTQINLNNYAQGADNIITIINRSYEGSTLKTEVTITISMAYTPASMVTPQGAEGNNCAHNPASLTSGFSSALNNPSGVTYEWQFHLPSEDYEVDPDPYEYCYTDCDPNNSSLCWTNCEIIDDPPYTVVNWIGLKNTGSPQVTFDPLSELFSKASNPDNQQVRASVSVQFRVRAIGGPRTGPWTPVIARQFVPPPPLSTSTPTAEPSCSNTPTGTITLNDISSLFTNYRYILKRGDITDLGCDPEHGGCLTNVQASDIHTGSTLTISNVPVDTYSLFLLNEGGTQGVCPRRIGGAIVVGPVPNLTVPQFDPSQIQCNGLNNGGVSLSITGGKYASVSYELSNITTTGHYSQSSTTANASISFTGLRPGDHSLTVADGCTPAVVKTFTITQPVKVSTGEFQKQAASCIDPGNGVAKITVAKSGTPDVSVSSTYHYAIYIGNDVHDEFDLDGTTYTWTGLPVSASYKIIVKEKDGQDCNGTTELFAIAGPAPLDVETPLPTKVTCFDGNNGAIKVTGKGGTGSYIYDLTGPAAASNSTGEFAGLKAGDYTITVRNTIACNDQYVYTPITVIQPTQVTATLSKKDISCYGLKDGEVHSVVTGGEPGGYTYTWETLLGGTWSQLSTTDDNLSALLDGTYRLQVKDTKNCGTTSNEVAVIEPGLIGISEVKVTDIRCYNETGAIAVTGEGGTGAYTFAYSVNGSTFTDFDAATPLTAGVYHVKVSDVNGCSFEHTGDHIITAPSAPVTFTEVLSNFNGFNISCYGGGNGSATITPAGGNGAIYTGYTYALDNGAYQTGATLSGIYAGDHELKVRDARGCVVSKILPFTQTTARLSAVLVERKDVACDGDVSGILEYTGDGGLPPYRYSLNNAAYQDQGRYPGLAIADYTITVKDKNDCDNTVTNSIVAVNPKIQISTAVTDVSCFAGSDGVIAATVSSGVPPFQYQWAGPGSASATATVTGLVIGNYTVTVTDKAGCKMQATAQVQQPLQGLSTALTAIPVCVGRANGSVTTVTRGGTSPYVYSIDNGQTFQSDPVFIRGVGTYTVTTRDSKGCLITATAEIKPRNGLPEPNFLAATTRNALDTLVLIDVSNPKPDSIHWVFDPKAIVISDNPWSPELRFVEAGTYVVSMTGYFAACDYTATKSLTVSPYDPNAVKEKLPGYKPIQSVSVTPNPSDGAFEVTVKLSKKYNLSVVVFDVLGNRHYQNTWGGAEEVTQSIVLNDVASGVYLVRVITESDAEDVRIVINK